MYKITFYVPTSHVEPVKAALFSAGAGKIGQYSCCAWQVLGEGQFMPLEGHQAFLGETNQLEKVAEYKVELVCDDNVIQQAVLALKQSHPYETPAYQVIKLENL